MVGTSSNVSSFLIVGDGFEAWLTALFLKSGPRGEEREIAVATMSQNEGETEPALFAMPSFRDLLPSIGVTEGDLVQHCDASFIAGATHKNWTGHNTSFDQAYGAYGAPANTAAFHHYWLRMQEAGSQIPYGDYSLGALLAREGKFIHPSANPKAIESSFDYGMAIDTPLFRDLLQRKAIESGVEVIDGTIVGVSTASDGTTISHLEVAGKPEYKADIYIDCSGSRRILSSALSTNEGLQAWPDLSARLSQQAEINASRDQNLSCIQTTANNDGYQVSLPLQSKISTYRIGAVGTNDETVFGHLDAPWISNCISIGQTACTLPPLHTPTLRIAEIGLSQLKKLMPTSVGSTSVEATEYNRLVGEAFDRLRDFQIIFELADTAPETESFDPQLQRKVDQFVSRGRVVMYDEESFTEAEWIAALLGLGYTPVRTSPLAETAPIKAVQKNYETLRERIAQSALRLPSQRIYIEHMLNTLNEAEDKQVPDAV